MARLTVYLGASGTKIQLTDADYVTSGGEGSIYIKKGIVYKIYLDPLNKKQHAINAVNFLSSIQHKNIATPTDILLDSKSSFVGIALPEVIGEPLCKLFTTTWQTANQFDDRNILNLTNNMRDLVQFVHSKKAIIVDGNELNWMANREEPFLIDTDSWKFAGNEPTAIMPSIRDPFAKSFNEGTDWYAWAIVTFQLWTGIHPFKGKHPNFKPGQFLDRMAKQISVFDSAVSMPPSVRDISRIPQALKNWYLQVFENGLRSPPPLASLTAQTTFKPNLVYHSNSRVTIDKIFEISGTIVYAHNGCIIVKQQKSFQMVDVNTLKPISWLSSSQVESIIKNRAVILRQFGTMFFVYLQGPELRIVSSSGSDSFLVATSATELWSSDGLVFLKNYAHATLEQVNFVAVSSKIIANICATWPINPKASKFGQQVLVQDVLGTPFVGIFKATGTIMYKAVELKGYAIVDAYAADSQNVFIKAINKKEGLYYLLELKYDGKGSFCLVNSHIDVDELSFAVLPSGAGVLKVKDELLLFKENHQKTVDAQLPNLELCATTSGLFGYRQDCLYRLALK